MTALLDGFLGRFTHFGVHLGLERIQTLLAALGNPQSQVPMIHVAGSNGKGSVCAYLSAVLTEAGYRVGRYTSPHLVDWCERICINEQPIAPAAFLQSLLQVESAMTPEAPATQFELITAAAWLYFAQQQVDLAVVEVGLGGRLDATNVCDRPLVSVITSLSREHWQRLGPTLADIAREKAGILKTGCPAAIGPLPPEAATVVQQRVSELGCPAVWVEPARMLEPNSQRDHPGLPWVEAQGVTYPLALQGTIQLTNSAIAIATLKLLQEQGWAVPESAIVQGMAKTHWAGRLQWFLWQNQRILIDGAHNPAAAEVLRQFVDGLEPLGAGTINWVMGMLSTKDHADVFQALLREGDGLYLVPVPDHLSAEPNQLATVAQSVCPHLAHCQVYPDVFTALDAAIDPHKLTVFAEQNLTVLCGSLYLIGHFFGKEAEIGD